MSERAPDPVVYEVALEADAAIEREFDTWLRDHVADMLALPGFLAADILARTEPPPPPGRVSRTVLYRLRDRDALDAYLRDHAQRMREHGRLRFGERFSAERRMLMQREEMQAGRISTDNCLNCGEVLSGQYCSYCGQRAKVRIISLFELVRDLVGDVFEFDSRVWRTLRPLLFRPGLLTAEYLRGRRVEYTPPFRMYLVLSLIFFVAVTFGPQDGFVLQFDGEPQTVTPADDPDPSVEATDAPSPTETQAPSPAADALEPDIERALEAVVARVPETDRAATRQALEEAIRGLPAADRAAAAATLEDPCSEENFRVDIPGFERYEARARQACNRIVADSGAGFGRALWENIPKMMFIFLPVIAIVNKILYLGSRRYYVEHLLFFVHFHAFFFLVITIDVLTWRVAEAAAPAGQEPSEVLPGIVTAVIVAYVPIYLYRAMRRVYAQGRFVTLIKFAMLVVAYFVSLLITFLGVLAYTALTL